MRSYVITIDGHEGSEASANKCIASGKKFGVDIENLYGYTPKDEPVRIAQSLDIPIAAFKEKYSRFENCLSAFLSHRSAWETCVHLNEDIQIFEHDAIIVNNLPGEIFYKGCMSLGAPSYGRFNVPQRFGVNPLTSKPYFPGAHAYRITPVRAKELIEAAKHCAMPTDIFLDIRRFPWLEEYYPWPVEARDNFTTIQNETGCLAKHRYGPGYQIL